MARDSTNPSIPWIEGTTPPAVVNVYEIVRVTEGHVTIRFGFDDGAVAEEMRRLTIPKDIAAAFGGSLLKSLGKRR